MKHLLNTITLTLLLFTTLVSNLYAQFIPAQDKTLVLDKPVLRPIKPIDDLVLLPAAKLENVYVQKWGTNTWGCGSETSPCLTIDYGVFRVKSTSAPYSTSSISNIYVGPGVYNENVVVDKTGVRIRSTHGREATFIVAADANEPSVYITHDGVYFGKNNFGFSLSGSNRSGLVSEGSYVYVYGNLSSNNGERGFEFGYQALGKSVTNNYVYYNVAENNGSGGFYFFDFDDSYIRYNEARYNQAAPGFFAMGSGFWIDMDSENDYLEYNKALGNEGSGIFYRRFGVTDQVTRYNKSSENQDHGFMLMGDSISISRNTSVNNVGDGFHFMGYDQVLEFTYNTSVGNMGSGVFFNIEVLAGATNVSNLHHNNFFDNDDIANPGSNNCGLTNNFQAGGLSPHTNFWGSSISPGPSADPADDLCGLATTESTPSNTMH